MLLIMLRTQMLVASVSSRKMQRVTTSITLLQLPIRKRKALIDFGSSPGLLKMKLESTITRFKNLMLLNSVELGSELKILSAIRS